MVQRNGDSEPKLGHLLHRQWFVRGKLKPNIVDGCPQDLCDGINSTPHRGGWQEDAHTDKIHNFVDAINALNGNC